MYPSCQCILHAKVIRGSANIILIIHGQWNLFVTQSFLYQIPTVISFNLSLTPCIWLGLTSSHHQNKCFGRHRGKIVSEYHRENIIKNILYDNYQLVTLAFVMPPIMF